LQFSPSQANAFGAQGSPIQFFFNAYFVRIAIMALAVHMEKKDGNSEVMIRNVQIIEN